MAEWPREPNLEGGLDAELLRVIDERSTSLRLELARERALREESDEANGREFAGRVAEVAAKVETSLAAIRAKHAQLERLIEDHGRKQERMVAVERQAREESHARLLAALEAMATEAQSRLDAERRAAASDESHVHY